MPEEEADDPQRLRTGAANVQVKYGLASSDSALLCPKLGSSCHKVEWCLCVIVAAPVLLRACLLLWPCLGPRLARPVTTAVHRRRKGQRPWWNSVVLLASSRLGLSGFMGNR